MYACIHVQCAYITDDVRTVTSHNSAHAPVDSSRELQVRCQRADRREDDIQDSRRIHHVTRSRAPAHGDTSRTRSLRMSGSSDTWWETYNMHYLDIA